VVAAEGRRQAASRDVRRAQLAEDSGTAVRDHRQGAAMKTETFPFRFVEVRGVRYLRLDDVASFVHELGNAEETDDRNRLAEAAVQLVRAQGKP
jgi:hypothetical protein